MSPEEGRKDDLGAGTPIVWRQADRAGFVQPGEEKVEGAPTAILSFLPGAYKEIETVSLFWQMHSERVRGSSHKLLQEKFQLATRENISQRQWCSPGKSAERAGGISPSGDTQNSAGHHPEPLEIKPSSSRRLDWTSPEMPHNFNYSAILWFHGASNSWCLREKLEACSMFLAVPGRSQQAAAMTHSLVLFI